MPAGDGQFHAIGKKYFGDDSAQRKLVGRRLFNIKWTNFKKINVSFIFSERLTLSPLS